MTTLAAVPLTMKSEEEKEVPTPELTPLTDGDVVSEEDGKYIGDCDVSTGPPIEMSLLYKGHWWIYKLDRKEMVEKDNESTDAFPA